MNDRLQAIRNKMAGLNLQGMIIVNPINIRYLTKIEAEGILILTRKENIFITDGRYMEYVSSVVTPFDEIVVDDQKNISKDEYENLKQFINEFAYKVSKMSDKEIQELENEFNIEKNLNFEKIIKGKTYKVNTYFSENSEYTILQILYKILRKWKIY